MAVLQQVNNVYLHAFENLSWVPPSFNPIPLPSRKQQNDNCPTYCIKLLVPVWYRNYLKGNGDPFHMIKLMSGAVELNDLSQCTFTSIQTPHLARTYSHESVFSRRVLCIKGSKEAVLKALCIVVLCLYGFSAELPNGCLQEQRELSAVHSIEVLIPAQLIGCILGKKGSTIREIQEYSGSKLSILAYNEISIDQCGIKFDEKIAEDLRNDRICRIKGTIDSLYIACEYIITIVEGVTNSPFTHTKYIKNLEFSKIRKPLDSFAFTGNSNRVKSCDIRNGENNQIQIKESCLPTTESGNDSKEVPEEVEPDVCRIEYKSEINVDSNEVIQLGVEKFCEMLHNYSNVYSKQNDGIESYSKEQSEICVDFSSVVEKLKADTVFRESSCMETVEPSSEVSRYSEYADPDCIVSDGQWSVDHGDQFKSLEELEKFCISDSQDDETLAKLVFEALGEICVVENRTENDSNTVGQEIEISTNNSPRSNFRVFANTTASTTVELSPVCQKVQRNEPRYTLNDLLCPESLSLLASITNKYRKFLPCTVIETSIHAKSAGTIIGGNGRNVRKIQDLSGATVNLSRLHDSISNESSRRLQICADSCESAYVSLFLCMSLLVFGQKKDCGKEQNSFSKGKHLNLPNGLPKTGSSLTDHFAVDVLLKECDGFLNKRTSRTSRTSPDCRPNSIFCNRMLAYINMLINEE